MFGTIVNALAILAGGLTGVTVRGGIPKPYLDGVIQAISLAVILIGFRMAQKSDAILLIILSLAIGTLIGEIMAIEERLEKLGKWLETRFSKAGDGFVQGFVFASLIYCVGSMAIVGSLESGLTGNHQTLYAKSMLDGITAIVFASSFGMGVIFSALSVLLYQGTITLLAAWMRPFLIPSVVAQMSAVGGLLILAIGINLLDIKRLKIGNMVPAIFIPLIYDLIKQLFY